MTTPWTPQEDKQLLFSVGVHPPTVIAARLGRSPRSVIERYKATHGGSFRRAAIREGGMSVAECARALGTNVVRVRKWVQRGWLKGHKRIVIEDRLLTIDADDFEAFLRERGGLLERIEPADPYWCCVFNKASCSLHARYINTAELSEIFGVIPSRFGKSRMIAQCRFPESSFSLQGHERWYDREAIKEWLMETAPARYRTPRVMRAFFS